MRDKTLFRKRVFLNNYDLSSVEADLVETTLEAGKKYYAGFLQISDGRNVVDIDICEGGNISLGQLDKLRRVVEELYIKAEQIKSKKSVKK